MSCLLFPTLLITPIHTSLFNILGEDTIPNVDNAVRSSYHRHCLTRHGSRSVPSKFQPSTLNVRYGAEFLTSGAQLNPARIRPHHCLRSMRITSQKSKYSPAPAGFVPIGDQYTVMLIDADKFRASPPMGPDRPHVHIIREMKAHIQRIQPSDSTLCRSIPTARQWVTHVCFLCLRATSQLDTPNGFSDVGSGE